MQVVENVEYNIKGEQKKNLILDVLNNLIDEQIDDKKEGNVQGEIDMKLFVKLTLPNIIDTFVSIDNKEVKIKLKNSNRLLACCGFINLLLKK